MVFTSLHFVGFFLVVYALYRVMPHRAQNWLLLAASYYFYAAWDWRFLGLIVASTLATFYAARAIGASALQSRRRAALLASLAVNLGMLGFFKYFSFFAENLHALFALAGLTLDVVTLRVLLPIGISFYTFIAISYVVDVYRRQIEPERNLRDFAVFIAYFPQLLAGPIARASMLLPQIRLPRRVTREQVVEGLWLIGYGFFKKVYVADNLSHLVNRSFGAAHPTGLQVLLSLYAFAFQIYGDFSGYTDMARGLSKLMGIELALNFRFPYFVRTPQQFWQQWHISLSTWLRDYLFLPVSFALSRRIDGVRWLGLRDEFWIYAGATVATMLLGGLWHGAAWTFVLWGAYQGALLVAFLAVHQWRRRGKRRRSAAPGRAATLGVARLAGAVGMFHLTCLGWLIFRADSARQIGDLAWTLVAGFAPSLSALRTFGVPVLAYAGPLLVVMIVEARKNDVAAVLSLPVAVRYSVYAAILYLTVLFGDFAGSQFIYFQF
jgi:D-alanyl-lipoteichoic acid acyltransferase DltB (MBOAT superfamily)